MERTEMYWMIVSGIFVIIQNAGVGYILYRFARPFMKRQEGAFCIGAVYFGILLVFYMIPVTMNNVAVYGFAQLAAFAVMCWMDRGNYRQKIYIMVTFFSLRWLSFYMIYDLTSWLYEGAIRNDFLMQSLIGQMGVYCIWEMLDICMSLAAIGLGVRWILKAYSRKYEAMSTREMFMLTLPSFSGMVGYCMMQYYNTFYEEPALGALSGIYKGLAFLYYTISVFMIVVVTVLFQNMKAGQEEKLQKELLAAQVDSIRQHIGQVESLYQDIRGIRHDMANHILTLERLYEGRESEEAKAYAADLKTALAQTAGEIRSGNPVTDVVLQEKKRQAEAAGIRFRFDFHYPPASRINAFDLSVILNNALQNAVEHASGGEAPYLSVRSYCRKNAYMIEVRNSFAGTLQWDTGSGLPATSKKKDGSGYESVHGYGLLNIRRVAQKYYGDIDIALKDGEFRLTILLMME